MSMDTVAGGGFSKVLNSSTEGVSGFKLNTSNVGSRIGGGGQGGFNSENHLNDVVPMDQEEG